MVNEAKLNELLGRMVGDLAPPLLSPLYDWEIHWASTRLSPKRH